MSDNSFPASDEDIRLDVAVKVAGRPCLVVGGGPVAVRRIERLVAAGAAVTVIAPTLAPLGVDSTQIRWLNREYRNGDTGGMWLVVAATGRFDVDSAVVAEASAAGILVNDATVAGRGDVTFPAVATEGAFTATFRTNGASPALSAWIRRRFCAQWDRIGEVTDLMGQARLRMAETGLSSSHPGWAQALDRGLVELVHAGQTAEARALLWDCLDLSDEPRGLSD